MKHEELNHITIPYSVRLINIADSIAHGFLLVDEVSKTCSEMLNMLNKDLLSKVCIYILGMVNM